MKLVSEIMVSLKKETLSQLVDCFIGSGCRIKSMSLSESEDLENVYICELIYQQPEQLMNCINTLKESADKFNFISTSTSLEHALKGGMLEISGRLPFESREDYELNVLGGAEIINDKIAQGMQDDYSGIEHTTANVMAMLNKDLVRKRLYPIHTIAERDSIIMKKFSGMNCVPVSFQYNQQEDCLRHIRNTAIGFRGMRILDAENSTMSFYEQLLDNFPIPLIIRELDEAPLYILALVYKCMQKHGLEWNETNIGILGVDNGVIRLTRLLFKAGLRRVLGYDGTDNILLEFEGHGALATTKENIIGNADIIILVKNNFHISDFSGIRPGQFIISMLPETIVDKKTIMGYGVREFIQSSNDDLSIIFPALLYGIITAGIPFLDDARMLDLAERMTRFITKDSYIFSEPPESVMDIISDFFALSGDLHG